MPFWQLAGLLRMPGSLAKSRAARSVERSRTDRRGHRTTDSACHFPGACFRFPESVGQHSGRVVLAHFIASPERTSRTNPLVALLGQCSSQQAGAHNTDDGAAEVDGGFVELWP